MKRQIVNIINFIRGCEPRREMDLVGTVREQIKLMNKHQLRGTFLLQYDALILPEYQEMLKELNEDQFEIGVWFEVVQPLVEEVGLTWTGRFPWDWHTHCGFSVGYTKGQRELLLDQLYRKFQEVFGYYPKVFGSWMFDTHTIRYISDKYGLDAVCNCKEQYGTDGYTLWGGYYGQGYYPSRNNVFMPAQTHETQIPAPIFRMLGPDQIYQYDFGLNINNEVHEEQKVITLEPACANKLGGALPKWIDWYMQENFNGECLSFGYTQAGQENSFGWNAIKDGLCYQFALFEKLQKEGKITVEPLGETGRWYKAAFPETPASVITAHCAYDDDQKNTVWYSSKYYRVNLHSDHGKLRIRDLHVFSGQYADPFEEEVCVGNTAIYETLPVIDGNRHSGNSVLAGGYLVYEDETIPEGTEMHFMDMGEGRALVTYGDLQVELTEDTIKVIGPKEFSISLRYGKHNDHMPAMECRSAEDLCLCYEGVSYGLHALQGYFVTPEMIRSSNKCLELQVRG